MAATVCRLTMEPASFQIPLGGREAVGCMVWIVRTLSKMGSLWAGSPGFSFVSQRRR